MASPKTWDRNVINKQELKKNQFYPVRNWLGSKNATYLPQLVPSEVNLVDFQQSSNNLDELKVQV